MRLAADYDKPKGGRCRNRVSDSYRRFMATIIVYKTYVTHQQLKRC